MRNRAEGFRGRTLPKLDGPGRFAPASQGLLQAGQRIPFPILTGRNVRVLTSFGNRTNAGTGTIPATALPYDGALWPSPDLDASN